MSDFQNTIFWKDAIIQKLSSDLLVFRDVELTNCLKKLESTGHEVVGIMFDGNNIDVLLKQKEDIAENVTDLD